MSGDKQIQKAGKGSQQNLAKEMTINNYGVSASDLSEILLKQGQYVREQCTEIANHIVDERLKEFDKRLISKFFEDEPLMNSYKKPEFQLLSREAQLSAIVSERDSDYDLLTQLLVCHVKKGEDIKNRAAIHQAVKIVSEIDNDALCGLTVAHAFWHYFPMAMTCEESLKILNDMFSKLIYQNLPIGKEWLEHLDVLGIVHISPFVPMEMRKIGDYYSSILSGIICTGIREGSVEFKRASDLLSESGISKNCFIPNECLDGYYRLSINNEESIDHLRISTGTSIVPLNEKQKQVIKQILGMYSNEPSMKKLAEERFVEKWYSFETLHKLKLWWEKTPYFVITPVGRILAHTNAKRCDPKIPDLI